MQNIKEVPPKKYDLACVTYSKVRDLKDVYGILITLFLADNPHSLITFSSFVLDSLGTSLEEQMSNLLDESRPSMEFDGYMERLCKIYFKSKNLECPSEEDFIILAHYLILFYVSATTDGDDLSSLVEDMPLPRVTPNKKVLEIYTRDGFMNKSQVDTFIKISQILLEDVGLKDIQLVALRELLAFREANEGKHTCLGANVGKCSICDLGKEKKFVVLYEC